MAWCWQHEAERRPPSHHISVLASTTEFPRLSDVITFDKQVSPSRDQDVISPYLVIFTLSWYQHDRSDRRLSPVLLGLLIPVLPCEICVVFQISYALSLALILCRMLSYLLSLLSFLAWLKLRSHGWVTCQSKLWGGRQGQCGVRGVALSERGECWDRYRKDQRLKLQWGPMLP